MDTHRMEPLRDQGQTRAATDSGVMHDKAASLDPAAVPHEADAEASGAPSITDAQAAASRHEIRDPMDRRSPNGSAPSDSPAGAGNGPSPASGATLGGAMKIGLAIVVVVLAIVAVAMA